MVRARIGGLDVPARLFGKWSMEDIEVSDLSLQDYVSKKGIYIPHSNGRWNKKKRLQVSSWII